MRKKRLIMLLVLVLAISLLVGCDLLRGIIDLDDTGGEDEPGDEDEITDNFQYLIGTTWQITKQTVDGEEKTIDTEVNRAFFQFTDDRIYFIVEDGDNHFITREYTHYWDEEAEKTQLVMGYAFYVEWRIAEGKLTWDMKIRDSSEEVYRNIVWEAVKDSDDIKFAEDTLLPKPEMIVPGQGDGQIEGVWRLSYQEEYDSAADFNDKIGAEVTIFPEYLEDGFRHYYMVFDEKAGQIIKEIEWNGAIGGEPDYEEFWGIDYEYDGEWITFSMEGEELYSGQYRLKEDENLLILASDLTEMGEGFFYNIYVKVEDEAVADYLP